MSRRPPGPGPARPFVPPTFIGTTLPNGLTVRAARWGNRPTAAVFVLYPVAGSVSDPPGREGVAEIVSDAIVGGTRRRSAKDLAERLDDLAATLDFGAGNDSTVARLFVLEKDLPEGLDLLREVLTEPSFPEEEIEKSRRRQIDFLAEQRSEPDFLARERLLWQLYPDHPYGRLTATEDGLLALTPADVVDFYKVRFDLSVATIVIVSSQDPEVLLGLVSQAFGPATQSVNLAVPLPESPATNSGFAIHLVNRPGAVQTNLLFARPAINRADARFPSAVVANQSLGGGAASRLFHVLREERGLTYGAYSSLSPRVLAGHFSASIDCRTEVTDQALDGLLTLVRDFANHGPEPAEHRRSLDYLRGSFVLGRETPGAIAQDEITRLLYGLPEDEWFTWRDRLSRVTIDEARAAASSFFSPETGVLAAVGDAAAIRPVLERFGPTTLWDADGPRHD